MFFFIVFYRKNTIQLENLNRSLAIHGISYGKMMKLSKLNFIRIFFIFLTLQLVIGINNIND